MGEGREREGGSKGGRERKGEGRGKGEEEECGRRGKRARGTPKG